MRYPLALRLRPSWVLMTSVLVVHVAAALAFFHVLSLRGGSLQLGGLAVPQVAAQTTCVVVLLGSVVIGLRREWAKRALRLVLADDGSVVCETPMGMRHYRLENGAVDLGYAIWLRFCPADADLTANRSARRDRRSLMLLRANLRLADGWRGLRIWLRHKAYAARRA